MFSCFQSGISSTGGKRYAIKDVAIVGGGLSGMTAAHYLKKAKPELRIIVLEANRERFGGRTYSPRMNVGVGPDGGRSDAFDLGGQWIGNTQTDILNLMAELRIQKVPQRTNGTDRYVNKEGRVLNITVSQDQRRYESARNPLVQELERLAGIVPPEDPFRTAVNATAWNEQTLHNFMIMGIMQSKWSMEDVTAVSYELRRILDADPMEISLLFTLMHLNAADGQLSTLFSDRGDGAGAFRVQHGAQNVATQIHQKTLAGKAVRMGDPVIRIIQHSKLSPRRRSMRYGTMVETINGRVFRVRKVIVAIPPNRVDSLIFLLSGEVVAKGRSGRQSQGRLPPITTYDYQTSNGSFGIVGTIDIPYSKSPENNQLAVLAQLEPAFGSAVMGVSDWRNYTWAADPWIRGSFASIGAGLMTPRFDKLMREPFGCVHWAGTETALKWMGFMSGAVNAGKRAAEEVLAKLQ